MKMYRLLTRTFAIFTVMLIATFMLIVFVYDYSMNHYAESEISRSATGKLKIIRSINELLVDFVSRDALKLSLNASLNDLYGAIKQTDSNERIDNILKLRDMFTVLEQMVSTSNTVKSVYVYLEDPGYIISSNYGAAYTKDFYDTDWIPEYLKANGQAVWLTSRIPMNADLTSYALKNSISRPTGYVTTYVFPLTPYTSQVKGAILINLNEDSLSQLMNQNNEEEGIIYIVNKNGEIVSHPDKSLIGTSIANQPYAKKILNGGQTEGYFIEKDDQGRELVSYYKSNVNDWTYVGVHSLDSLTTKANALRLNLAYLFILLLAVELIVSYFILKRLYSPVRQLIHTLKQQRKLNLNENENEVTVLSKAFNEIVKQEEQLFNALEKNKQTIRDQAVLGLLNGQELESVDSDLLDVRFSFPAFICAVLVIDRYKDFQAAFPENHQYYLRSVVLKMCQDVLQKPWKSIGIILDKNRVALIINCEILDRETYEPSLRGTFEFVQNEMKKLTGFTVSVGVGGLHEGIDGIEISYEEAGSAVQRRLMSGHASVLFHKDWVSDLPKSYYPAAKENAVFNQLQLGSLPGVEKSILEFMEEIREETVDQIHLILNQFVAATIKYAMELHIHPGDLASNPSKNIYQQLLDQETLDDIGQWLISVYRKMLEHMKMNKSGSPDYIDQAMTYIQQNFRSDIDLNELAERIGVSYSQLRRRFQSETGENMLSYINKLRIEQAKQLLRQSSISILDIAINLGYNNEQSFNRYFKKFEGITPGEYRKIK